MSDQAHENGPVIAVNRAPVLTLWASVVARRLGHPQAEALTLGKAVAGLNAASEGRRLGIYQPAAEGAKPVRPASARTVDLCGRAVPVVEADGGRRAISKGVPINPDAVERYLQRSFGDGLAAVREAMTGLAKAYKPKELGPAAYGLYEQFRPDVPKGKRGWGAQGQLSLGRINGLAKVR